MTADWNSSLQIRRIGVIRVQCKIWYADNADTTDDRGLEFIRANPSHRRHPCSMQNMVRG